jgi:hypothetical protein
LFTLETGRGEGSSVRNIEKHDSKSFDTNGVILNNEEIFENVKEIILRGRYEEASYLSYHAIKSLCESKPESVSSFLKDLVYGPFSKSETATLMLINLLSINGFPASCVDQLAVLPLSITYSIPQGSILENDTLLQSLFNFIKELLIATLTASEPVEKLYTVYLELNTFFSELSRILAENREASKFRALFSGIEKIWILLASRVLSSNGAPA